MNPVQQFAWTHPEWWAWALCAGGWGLLLLRHAHAEHHAPQTFSVLEWTVMVVAMMVPLVVTNLRATAARSLWRRRHRAMAGFLCGYATVWIVGGAALAVVVNHVIRLASPWVLAVMAFMVASAWELTAVKRRALAACHAMLPLSATGWRADLDTLRYGSYVGSRCMTVCGLSMIGCALSGHGLVLIATISAVLYGTRYRSRSKLLNAIAVAGLGLGVLFTHR